MIFITQCDSPALWQTYLSDPASITMEGILTFNKHLLFLLTVIVLFVGWLLFHSVHYFTEYQNTSSSKYIRLKKLATVSTFILGVSLLILSTPSIASLYPLKYVLQELIANLFPLFISMFHSTISKFFIENLDIVTNDENRQDENTDRQEDNTEQLGSLTVFMLADGCQQVFWAPSDSGVLKCDENNGQFVHYKTDEDDKPIHPLLYQNAENYLQPTSTWQRVPSTHVSIDMRFQNFDGDLYEHDIAHILGPLAKEVTWMQDEY